MAWKIGLTSGQAFSLPPGIMLGPFRRPFLAAGDARADVQQPLRLDVLRPPLGIAEVGIAAVDDHVARRQQRNQLLDELVDGRARLDHQHHLARRGQAADQLLQRVAAAEALALGRGPAMKSSTLLAVRLNTATREAAALDVQGQVLAHHRQADQAEITLFVMDLHSQVSVVKLQGGSRSRGDQDRNAS